MKKFDIKRFLLTLKWDLISNWKDSLKIMLTLTFALLLVFAMMLFTRRNVEMTGWMADNTMREMGVLSLLVFVVFMIVGASHIFGNMKTKQQRTAFLMLPVSNAEKFVARWLWATVGQVVIYMVALVVADLLQALFGMLIGVGALGSVTARVLHAVGNIFCGFTREFYDIVEKNTGIALTLSILVMTVMIFIHAFYIFGGTFFRRNAWLLTTCVGIVMVFVTASFDLNPDRIYSAMDQDKFVLILNLWSGGIAVLTVIAYWLSYLLFKRMQVINNKWINV